MASLTLPDVLKNYQICLVQDITERKRLEEELLESERSKSVFLSNLPAWLIDVIMTAIGQCSLYQQDVIN